MGGYDPTVALAASNIVSGVAHAYDFNEPVIARAVAATAVRMARLIVEETQRTEPRPETPKSVPVPEFR